jgi:glycerol uptake facilitator-like aquaporin
LILSTVVSKNEEPKFELLPFTVFTGVTLVPPVLLVLLSGSSLNPARDIATAVFGSFVSGSAVLAHVEREFCPSYFYISLAALIVVGIVWAVELPILADSARLQENAALINAQE